MVTWMVGGDNFSPAMIDKCREQAASLFFENAFGRHISAVSTTVLPDGRAGIMVELREAAEVINDDDVVLAVLEELYVPLDWGTRRL